MQRYYPYINIKKALKINARDRFRRISRETVQDVSLLNLYETLSLPRAFQMKSVPPPHSIPPSTYCLKCSPFLQRHWDIHKSKVFKVFALNKSLKHMDFADALPSRELPILRFWVRSGATFFSVISFTLTSKNKAL